MEDNALVEQEEAFRKMNAELELRTRKLMKQVEEAITKQDVPGLWSQQRTTLQSIQGRSAEIKKGGLRFALIDGNKSSDSDLSDDVDFKLENIPRGKRSTSADVTKYHSPTVASRRRSASPSKKRFPTSRTSYNETSTGRNSSCRELIPASAKSIGSEGLIRFLKAKVKVLQDELSCLQKDYMKRTDDWKKLQVDLKQAEDDRSKALQDITAIREKLKKHEATIASFQDKLQLRDAENSVLKKEIDLLKQDLKKLNHSSSGSDLKLNSAKEEIEKLKQEIKKNALKEKDMRDKSRVKNEELVAAIRKLEKQKSHLISAFKKQLQMIENLKRHKSYTESGTTLRFTEEEFLKLLEWKPEEAKEEKLEEKA